MQSVTITTDVVSSNLEQSEMYNIVIKFVSDLWHVAAFLQDLQFLPQINWLPRYSWNTAKVGVKHKWINQ